MTLLLSAWMHPTSVIYLSCGTINIKQYASLVSLLVSLNLFPIMGLTRNIAPLWIGMSILSTSSVPCTPSTESCKKCSPLHCPRCVSVDTLWVSHNGKASDQVRPDPLTLAEHTLGLYLFISSLTLCLSCSFWLLFPMWGNNLAGAMFEGHCQCRLPIFHGLTPLWNVWCCLLIRRLSPFKHTLLSRTYLKS